MRKCISIAPIYTRGTLRFFGQGRIGVSTSGRRTNHNQPKLVFLDCGDCGAYDAFRYLEDRTYISPSYASGDFVYVHPKARISRDLLRNSGYHITRDPDKCKFYIVPQPNMYDCAAGKYNFACIIDGRLYLFDVVDSNNNVVPDEKLDEVKNRITNYYSGQEIKFISDNLRQKYCTFLPDIEIYDNIISRKYHPYYYVFDTKIQLTPSTNISVETLDLWSRLDDMNMLGKLLCSSDWKEYPVTLSVFLEEECYGIKHINNQNVKMILHEIYFDCVKEDMAVTPKDYNMLVSWIYHKLGCNDVKATYVPYERYIDLDTVYRNMLRKTVCIAPKAMPQETTYGNLRKS